MVPRRSVFALTALVMLAALAGCAPGPAEPSGGAPAPSAPELTFHPTFDEFSQHAVGAPARFGTFVSQLATASAGSPQDVAAAAGALNAWVAGELAWWQEHDVDECYAAAFGAYGDALGAARDAANAFAQLGATGAPIDDAAGAEAAVLLTAASDQFTAAASLAAAARAECQ